MEKEKTNILGNKLQIARKERGITLKELSQKLGVSFQFINNYERGVRTPTLESLLKILFALEICPEEYKEFSCYIKTSRPFDNFIVEQLGHLFIYNEPERKCMKTFTRILSSKDFSPDVISQKIEAVFFKTSNKNI